MGRINALERPPGTAADLYISFADDERFRGVVVVPPSDLPLDEVLAELGKMGLNPGGDALAFLVPAGAFPHFRLLGPDDLGDDGVRASDLTADELALALRNAWR